MKFILVLLGLACVSALHLEAAPTDGLLALDALKKGGRGNQGGDKKKEKKDKDGKKKRKGKRVPPKVLGMVTSLAVNLAEAVEADADGSFTLGELQTAGWAALNGANATEAAANKKKYGVPANVTQEQFNGWCTQLFQYLDTDNSTTLEKDEILRALFDFLDQNDDGELNWWELRAVVRAYAKFEGIKLKKGWKKEVAEWFKHVDTDKSKGVSLKELEAFLQQSGHHLDDLDDAVRSLEA